MIFTHEMSLGTRISRRQATLLARTRNTSIRYHANIMCCNGEVGTRLETKILTITPTILKKNLKGKKNQVYYTGIILFWV